MSSLKPVEILYRNEIACLKGQIKALEVMMASFKWYTVDETAELLNTDEENVLTMIEENKILHYKTCTSNKFLIPAFQFKNNVCEYVKKLLKAVSNDYTIDSNRNILMHILNRNYSFNHDNEYGTKSETSLPAIKYLAFKGDEAVDHIASVYHDSCHPSMGR